MAEDSTATTAVLVVRLWREEADGPGFRARILHSRDVEREPEQATVARDADELLAIVRAWLDAVLTGP